MKLRREPMIKKSLLLFLLGFLVLTIILLGIIFVLLENAKMDKAQLKSIMGINIGLFLLGAGGNVLLFLHIAKKILDKLEGISFIIDRIMDGDISHISDPAVVHEEGILSRLEFQFYQLSRRMKLNLEELNLEKENIKSLVADISHQIKTPLASIKLFNDMLLEEDLSLEERDEFQQNIKSEVDKLQWLSHSLIKISRLEAGVMEIKREDRDIKETLLKAVNAIYLKALKKTVQVELDNIESIVLSHDPKWTQEAIFNVLENAVKYTPQGGRIKIIVEKLETYIKIDIQDTGIGIAHQELGRIFHRFYRGKSFLIKDSEGSGIGLYLSRRILEEQGGNIIASSKEGEGAIFSIFLNLQNCKDKERTL